MRNPLSVRILLPLVLILSYALNTAEARATDRRVPADYSTIQQAINAAVDSDTVLVSPGTYVENINFIGKAITVTSVAGAELTIIDGGDIKSVVQFNSNEGPTSILQGFTLRNGGLNPVNYTYGGGIAIVSASPTISNNIITDNKAEQGGGIYILTFNPSDPIASPVIKNNLIKNNKVRFAGGGISIFGASPIVQGNTIINNGTLAPPPFDHQIDGAGIFMSAYSAQILDNLIADNDGRSGGGIEVLDGLNSIIKGNTIRDNHAATGGGINLVGITPVQIIQNLIVDNHSWGGAGGITWDNPPMSVIGNTVANNDCSESSGISAGFSDTTEFTNNIILAKPGQRAYVCSESSSFPAVFKFNDVFSPQGEAYQGACSDPSGVNGNISADPLFINPLAGDYHLTAKSPCVDAGDNLVLNLPSVDLNGTPRFQDGNHDGVAIVDLGVYEFDASLFALSSIPPPVGARGISYFHQFTAAGGTEPYTWLLALGRLPAGLMLSQDGKLNGTPTAADSYNFSVQAVDSDGRVTSQNYTLNIIELPVIRRIKYKTPKRKLAIIGEKFSLLAMVYIDGNLAPRTLNETFSIVIKGMALESGSHLIRVVNPDGGEVSRSLVVP